MPGYERGYEREEYITTSVPSRPRVTIRQEPVEEIYVETRRSTEKRRPTTPYYEEERYERYETESEPSHKSTNSRRKSVDIKTTEKKTTTEKETKTKTKHKACSSVCKDHPSNQHSDSEYDSSEYEARKRSARKKKLLAAGLATVTTVAAINGAINHTKAAKERRKALANGEICTAEYELLKTKSRARDVFSLGVVAVGINNVHNAWKKHHAQRIEYGKVKEKRRGREGEYEVEEMDYRRRSLGGGERERRLVGSGGRERGGRRELQETAFEETYREREAWSGRDRSKERDGRYL